MTNGLLIYGEIFAHFLINSTYMTLQLLHSEFPYILRKFDFLYYQCAYQMTRTELKNKAKFKLFLADKKSCILLSVKYSLAQTLRLYLFFQCYEWGQLFCRKTFYKPSGILKDNTEKNLFFCCCLYVFFLWSDCMTLQQIFLHGMSKLFHKNDTNFRIMTAFMYRVAVILGLKETMSWG